MGLDMWLERKTEGVESRKELTYWRKANAIHKFFTDGILEDNCRDIPVTEEQLRDLQEKCYEVLTREKKPEEVLPTESGFFFGTTEYNEYYYGNLLDTYVAIGKILEEEFPLDDDEEIVYHAWY